MRRTKHNIPRAADPWDVHVEAAETSIQHWMLMRLTDHSDLYLEIAGMPSFKDILGGVAKASQDIAMEDAQFSASYPTLYALMAVLKDDDGKPRKGCSLTMVCEDGVIKLGLSERNHKLSLWTSSESLAGALAALEEACNERPPRWRKVEWEGKNRR